VKLLKDDLVRIFAGSEFTTETLNEIGVAVKIIKEVIVVKREIKEIYKQ